MIAQNKNIAELFHEMAGTPAAYAATRKKLKNPELQPMLLQQRIVILSTYTAEALKDFLIVEMARRGISAELIFCPFGQLEQQAIDPASMLYASTPDAIFVLTTPEDFIAGQSNIITKDSCNDALIRSKALMDNVRKNADAAIFFSNMTDPFVCYDNIAESNIESPLHALIHQFNLDLSETARSVSNCYVIDQRRAIQSAGFANSQDRKLAYMGKIPFSVTGQISTAKTCARILAASIFPPAKCLVLDADNTLWGGIIGEDGMDGIKLSDDYPGAPFKAFQQYILDLTNRGVILAMASKNNHDDVMQVLTKHPDCILQPEKFAAVRINWQDKASTIRELAQELNIGLSSMVFCDDNPTEREWVKSQLPEVIVPEMPKSALRYIDTLAALEAFDHIRLSKEDAMRGQMYQQQKKRTEAQATASSMEDFLQGLEMQATLSEINLNNIDRAVQLLNKTNQFNLTLRRHNASDVENILKTGGVGLTLRVKDRFGDNGIVGLALAKPDRTLEEWEIDSFLLSCRVLGRQVEDLMLSELFNKIEKHTGSIPDKIHGHFTPGKKNAIVEDFYADRGFRETGDNIWSIAPADSPPTKPAFFKVEYKD